jgi:glycosyltransferase involved in cell wall biosynthesis
MQELMKVSCVVTTKNEERFVGACLQSVKEQCDEIVVVDAYSEDKTADVCLKYTSKFFKADCNIPEGRNMGAAHASGDVLLFVCADTVLSPDWVKLTLPHLQEDNVVAVYGKSLLLEQGFKQTLTYCGLELLDTLFFRRIRIAGIGGGGMAFIIKADVFRRIGGFNERLAHVEDSDLSMRLGKIGKVFFERKAVSSSSVRSLEKFGYVQRILYWSKESFNWLFRQKLPRKEYPR